VKYGLSLRSFRQAWTAGTLKSIISQIIDDYISYNPKESALLCKQTHRTLRKGDAVRSRITTISLSGSSLRQCKIGLTMRQPFLGALKWIEEDLKKRKEGK